MILLVSLYIHAGQEAAFREFETAAARIMGRYGGRIERVIRPVVTFPDAAAFAAYRADGESAGLAGLRQAAITRTEIVLGEEGEVY